MPSIKDQPYPEDLVPLAERLSVEGKIPLGIARAMIVHMQTVAASISAAQVLSVVKEGVKMDELERALHLKAFTSHSIVWLLLADSLGIPEPVLSNAVGLATRFCTEHVSQTMRKLTSKATEEMKRTRAEAEAGIKSKTSPQDTKETRH